MITIDDLKFGKKDIYSDAVNKWGIASQLQMMQEECAELIVAINKHFRCPCAENVSKIIDEISDVEIMSSQMRVIFGDSLIDNHKKEKLKRLQKLIKGE